MSFVIHEPCPGFPDTIFRPRCSGTSSIAFRTVKFPSLGLNCWPCGMTRNRMSRKASRNKRFSGMVLCGEDDLIKAFLLPGQLAEASVLIRFHCDRFGRSNPVCRRGNANVPLAFARELLIECEVQQQHVQARLSEQTERAGLCIFRNQLLDLLHAYAARPRDARRLDLG